MLDHNTAIDEATEVAGPQFAHVVLHVPSKSPRSGIGIAWISVSQIAAAHHNFSCIILSHRLALRIYNSNGDAAQREPRRRFRESLNGNYLDRYALALGDAVHEGHRSPRERHGNLLLNCLVEPLASVCEEADVSCAGTPAPRSRQGPQNRRRAWHDRGLISLDVIGERQEVVRGPQYHGRRHTSRQQQLVEPVVKGHGEG